MIAIGKALKERDIGRIAVIGAGAVGSALGALLHHAGQNVVLIARPEHISAIRQDGLRVDGETENFIVPLEATETLHFRPDLALLSIEECPQSSSPSERSNPEAFCEGLLYGLSFYLYPGVHQKISLEGYPPLERVLRGG
jgi:hypothetical protein